MGKTKDVHIMTPGKGVANSFPKVLRSRKFRVDSVYVLKHKELEHNFTEDLDKIVDSIKELEKKCKYLGIDFSIHHIDEISINEIVIAAIDIKNSEEEKCTENNLRMFFNITHGVKTYSIGGFLSSLWINATPYYIHSKEDKIDLLKTPKIEPYKVQKNPNYLPILKILDKHESGISNKEILNKMERGDMFTRVRNKGKTEKLTPGNLSSMLRNLEEWGLIRIEEGRSRRENSNKITENGKLMLKVLENE